MAASGVTRYIWCGNDPYEGHVNGVPARDLNDTDWEALDDDQRKAVLATGLYKATRHATGDKQEYAEEKVDDKPARKDEDKPAAATTTASGAVHVVMHPAPAAPADKAPTPTNKD